MSETSDKLKVFVSYSRDDLAFAEQIVLALEERGFDTILDRHDIDAAEAWKDRLGDLLFRCDTVVFVLTPRSAASPICRWEVSEAARLGKRMIPVVPAPLDEVDAPPELAAFNYILFYPEPKSPGSGFYDGVIKLDRALKVDLAWLREATRLSEAAAAWRAADGDEDRLLRGAALEEAQAWRSRTPAGAELQDETLVFLTASEDVELRRRSEAEAQLEARRKALAEREAAVAAEKAALEDKAQAEQALRDTEIAAAQEREQAARRIAARTRAGAVAAGVLALAAIVAGAFAYWQGQEARAALTVAQAAEREADLQRDAATEALRDSQINAARYIAGEVRKLLADGAYEKGLALSLAALPDEFDEGGQRYAQEALAAVRSALSAINGRDLVGHASGVHASAFSRDSRFVATGSADNTARIWRVDDGASVATLAGHEDWVTAVAFGPDAGEVATGSRDGSVKIWRRGEDGAWRSVADLAGHPGSVEDVAFSPDGRFLASGSSLQTTRLWRRPTSPDDQWTLIGEASAGGGPASAVAFSPDGARLLVGAPGAAYIYASDGPAPNGALRGATVRQNHSRFVEAVAYAPDGAMFVAGAQDEMARVWRRTEAGGRETWEAAAVLSGHVGTVFFTGFADDGRFILTASADDTVVRFWERLSGRDDAWFEIGGWAAHDNLLYTAAVSPDGRHVATGAVARTPRLWPVDAFYMSGPELIAAARARLGDADPLSEDEKCRYAVGDQGEACG